MYVSEGEKRPRTGLVRNCPPIQVLVLRGAWPGICFATGHGTRLDSPVQLQFAANCPACHERLPLPAVDDPSRQAARFPGPTFPVMRGPGSAASTGKRFLFLPIPAFAQLSLPFVFHFMGKKRYDGLGHMFGVRAFSFSMREGTADT